MVNRRTLIGGPAPVRVREQVSESRELLKHERAEVEVRRVALSEAAEKLENAIDTLIAE
jgi:hypothetical protein